MMIGISITASRRQVELLWRLCFLSAALLTGSCSFNSPELPPRQFGKCGGTHGSCPKELICTTVQTTTGPMDLCCKTEGCATETEKLPSGVGPSEGAGGAKGSGGLRDAGPVGRGGAGGAANGTGGAAMNTDAGPNAPVLSGDAGAVTETGRGLMDRVDGRALSDAPGDTSPGCSGACTVGTKRCGAGKGVQFCTEVQGCGAWASETKCSGVQTCGGTEPNAACTCPAAPKGCEAGQGSLCESTATLATCVADAQGCVTISGRITCAAGKPCTGIYPKANCSCPPAPSACAAGTGTSCQENTLVTCALDASGCVAVTTMTACPAGKPCAGTAPNAACTCPTAPAGCNGQASGKFCALSAVATCAAAANGCVTASSTTCASGCIGSHPTASCCGPACTGKCGGADGCGGLCPNNCSGPQTCGGGGTMYVCGCTASCTGKCGGADGCGGTCAQTCATGTHCENAICQPGCLTNAHCTPDQFCSNNQCTSDVVQSGGGSRCFVHKDGTLRCEMGSGTTPIQVPGIQNAKGFTAGTALGNACVLLGDGTVKCWGNNAQGGVGDGTYSDRTDPRTVQKEGGTNLTGVTFLDDTCAIAAGDLWCWGTNGYFSTLLRPSTIVGSNVAVRVMTSQRMVATAKSSYSRGVLNDSGYVCVWGYINGTKMSSNPMPTCGQVPGGVQLSMDDSNGAGACARTASGTVSCWAAGSLPPGTPFPAFLTSPTLKEDTDITVLKHLRGRCIAGAIAALAATDRANSAVGKRIAPIRLCRGWSRVFPTRKS